MENVNSEEVVQTVIENRIDNASFALVKALKADIKTMNDAHVKRKREGFQDWSTSQEIRAHLIAYCLLRNKPYKEMEKKCSEFNPGWWDWYTLIRNINKVCLKYSLTENHEKWTVKNIETTIAEARSHD